MILRDPSQPEGFCGGVEGCSPGAVRNFWGENSRVCGLLQSSSPYLEHSPTSQTVGEVGKDGKVGKRVRGVECGCDVRLQPRAAELHSRRGLAGAGRVGDIIKNKKNKPQKVTLLWDKFGIDASLEPRGWWQESIPGARDEFVITSTGFVLWKIP